MRKIFLILAVAIGALSFGASAQGCAKGDACKEAAKCKQECPSTKGDCKASVCHDVLFKGITLTEAQKTEIQTLKNNCKTECTKTQACEKGKAECAKTQTCEKGKTGCTKTQTCEKGKTECAKTQACEKGKTECKDGSKKKFDGAIKKILTPEQYAIFVTNAKEMKAKCTKQVSNCCKK